MGLEDVPIVNLAVYKSHLYAASKLNEIFRIPLAR